MKRKTNIIICGNKAHASLLFVTLSKAPELNVVAVFSNLDDKFCLLGGASLQDLATAAGIKVYDARELNLNTLRNISKNTAIDLIVLAEWRELLGEELFNLPRYGIYNIHDSLLPRYRGSSPMNWAIINGERFAGVTFYKITSRADAGPIYCQKRIAIGSHEYAIDLVKKFIKAYGQVGLEGIRAVLTGKRPRIQNESKATYCAKRLPKDGFINFNDPVAKIYNMVRALSEPFPGAFTYYKGEKVIITRASVVKDKFQYDGLIPGYMLKSDKVLILCGSGILRVEEVEGYRDGIKITDPKEFFNDALERLTSIPVNIK